MKKEKRQKQAAQVARKMTNKKKKAKFGPARETYYDDDEARYQQVIDRLKSRKYTLMGIADEEFDCFDGITDAYTIATAYGEIAAALETLRDVSIPFETVWARLEGTSPAWETPTPTANRASREVRK